MTDDLTRFVAAQQSVYATALKELQAGCKRGHWMWFIFPQIAGLGQSATSQLYAIRSVEEAQAYLRHPFLGPRLHECTHAMLRNAGRGARDILGEIDAVKLRSSMTLFELAASPDRPSPFGACLDRFFAGRRDEATLRLAGLGQDQRS